MADLVPLYRRSVEGFAARVAAVNDSQWGDPTPCAGWDVRALVNHVVSEDLWAVPLLAGQTIEEVGDRFDGDVLGDDAKAAWAAAAEAAVAAVGEPGVIERTVHLSFGETAAEEYLTQLTMDHAVHGWDLARATGGDERVDPDVIELALDYLTPRADGWRAAGVFGPAVDVPDDADPQTRLLGLTGRQV